MTSQAFVYAIPISGLSDDLFLYLKSRFQLIRTVSNTDIVFCNHCSLVPPSVSYRFTSQYHIVFGSHCRFTFVSVTATSACYMLAILAILNSEPLYTYVGWWMCLSVPVLKVILFFSVSVSKFPTHTLICTDEHQHTHTGGHLKPITQYFISRCILKILQI